MSSERDPLMQPAGYGATSAGSGGADPAGALRLDPEAGAGDGPPPGFILQRNATHFRIRKSTTLIWTVYTVLVTAVLALMIGVHFSQRRESESDAPETSAIMSPLPFYPSKHTGRFVVLTDVHLEPNYDAHNQNAALAICRSAAAAAAGVCAAPAWTNEPDASAVAAASYDRSVTDYPFGRYNCDPPLALLQSALDSIVATGLAIAHDSGQSADGAGAGSGTVSPANALRVRSARRRDDNNNSPAQLIVTPPDSGKGKNGGAAASASLRTKQQAAQRAKMARKLARKDAQRRLAQRRRANAAARAAAKQAARHPPAPPAAQPVPSDAPSKGGDAPDVDWDEPSTGGGGTNGLDFVLLPGDLAAHGSTCANSTFQTVAKVMEEVSLAFPSTPVFFALGNNDVFPFNFLTSPLRSGYPLPPPAANIVRTEPCDPQLRILADLLLQYEWITVENRETFCRGGYYARTFTPASGDSSNTAAAAQSASASAAPSAASATPTALRLRMISLNTVLWSIALRTNSDPTDPSSSVVASSCESRGSDPSGQLAWLEHQLASVEKRGEKAYIIGHVPAGDKAGTGPNLCAAYQTRYLALVTRYSAVIVSQFFGDHSFDEWRLVWSDAAIASAAAAAATAAATNTETATVASAGPDSGSSVPAYPVSRVFISPGLSPRKHCNPAYRVFWYDRRTAEVVDYAQFAANLQAANINAAAFAAAENGGGSDADSDDTSSSTADATASADTDADSGDSSSLHGNMPLVDRSGDDGDGVEWQLQYSFRAEYDVPNLSLQSLHALLHRLQTNATLMARYVQHFNADYSGDFDLAQFWCDARYSSDATANAECRRTGQLEF